MPEPHSSDSPAPASRSLDARWWWSSSLPVIVGLVVIGYQVSAFADGVGTWANGAMIALGGAVALWGLAGLRKDYAAHRAASRGDRPSS